MNETKATPYEIDRPDETDIIGMSISHPEIIEEAENKESSQIRMGIHSQSIRDRYHEIDPTKIFDLFA
jgi:hypothetical protein